MKINGVDIKTFNAKQMTVEFQPMEVNANAEWNELNLLPSEFKTSYGFSTLKLKLYFKSSTRSNTLREIAKFISLINGAVNLELNGYKGKYKAYIESAPTIESSKEHEKKYLVLNFRGYMYDDEIKIYVIGQTPKVIELVGTRIAPCSIELTTTQTTKDVVLKGFGSDILIKELKPTNSIIVDGVRGLVTLDDKTNAFDIVDLWEFPYVGRKTTVTISSGFVSATIKYRPMWL